MEERVPIPSPLGHPGVLTQEHTGRGKYPRHTQCTLHTPDLELKRKEKREDNIGSENTPYIN
eukprot:1162063-Pelagomonas_calceolata.AAC.3